MERNICVLFDWDEAYWNSRISKPDTKYEIMRNIFCVAASRGKHQIVFATSDYPFLTSEKLKTDPHIDTPLRDMPISGMFDFKFAEDVEEAYNCLDIKEIPSEKSIIDIKTNDGMIDLSPCIGIYQKAAYFDDYDIDSDLALNGFLSNGDSEEAILKYLRSKQDHSPEAIAKKVLSLTALETKQNRYYEQVSLPFVGKTEYQKIASRLNSRLEKDSTVQVRCELPFCDKKGKELFRAIGFADAIKDDVVYELKFVSALAYTHFLQCAMYTVCLGLPTGRLWNVRTNQIFEIRIPQKQRFLDLVARAVTKGRLGGYYLPSLECFYDYPHCPGLDDILHPDPVSIPAGKYSPSQHKAFEFFDAHPKETTEIAQIIETVESRKGRINKDFIYNKYKEWHIEPPYKSATLNKHFRAYRDCHPVAVAAR